MNLDRNATTHTETADADRLRLVEVAWPTPDPVVPRVCHSETPERPIYRITTPMGVVEVGDDFDDDTLARLLLVTRSC